MPKPAAPLIHRLDQTRFVSYPMPETVSVAALVLVGVGSRYETADQSGIAHFLEHLFFKGTDARPTGPDIAAAVDQIGGEFNAFTSKEYTGFYIKSAAKDVATSLDVLSDILFHSTFPSAEIERERGVIIEEMNMYLDSPRERVGEIYEQLLYPDQPLGREVIGNRQTVQSFNRDQFVNFASQWYAANNLIIGLAGQFNQDETLSLVKEKFQAASPHQVANFTPAHVQQVQPKSMIQTKATDQTHVVVGFRSFASQDPRRYALAILNTILGGNMSSRLFTEVREKRGLAYAVQTHVEDYQDTGSLQCQVGLDVQQLPDTLRVILDQFAKIRNDLVTETELDRAKSYLRGRLALSLEDPLSVTFFQVKQLLLEGNIQTPEQILDQIDQVTASQIQAVAQEILVPSGLNLSAIGPVKNQETIESILASYQG